MRGLCTLAVTAALTSGCIVVDNKNPPPRTCALPTAPASQSNYPQFNVYPGASTAIPAGDIGFLVTANGQGGYRVTWTDTINSPACFQGIIRATGGFDVTQTRKFSGLETVQAVTTGEIRFSSVPGSDVDGVDMVSLTDPIFLDAYIDGRLSGVRIYYTDSGTRAITNANANPAAFISP